MSKTHCEKYEDKTPEDLEPEDLEPSRLLCKTCNKQLVGFTLCGLCDECILIPKPEEPKTCQRCHHLGAKGRFMGGGWIYCDKCWKRHNRIRNLKAVGLIIVAIPIGAVVIPVVATGALIGGFLGIISYSAGFVVRLLV